MIAYKGKQGECRDHGQAVIYTGPFKAVLDDDEHVFSRGVPTAVCAKNAADYAHARRPANTRADLPRRAMTSIPHSGGVFRPNVSIFTYRS